MSGGGQTPPSTLKQIESRPPSTSTFSEHNDRRRSPGPSNFRPRPPKATAKESKPAEETSTSASHLRTTSPIVLCDSYSLEGRFQGGGGMEGAVPAPLLHDGNRSFKTNGGGRSSLTSSLRDRQLDLLSGGRHLVVQRDRLLYPYPSYVASLRPVLRKRERQLQRVA